MIRFSLILFFIAISKVLLSQQDEQFSQYMYNQLDFNPGSAGSKEAINASLLGRNQWVGIKGAPTTQIGSINAPVKLFKLNSGVGLTILSDKAGYDNNFGVKLSYAYRMDVNNGIGKLGIGFSAGYLNNNIKITSPSGTWSAPGDATAPTNDGSIPMDKQSGSAFDFGLGLFYKTDNLYLGLSSTHLLQPDLTYKSGGAKVPKTRTFYLTASYNIAMKNPLFDLQPSLLISSVGSSSSADLNCVLLYNKKVWGGVTYRVGAAIIGMVGIELMSGLRIGYSYDFSTTSLGRYNSGSHEIMVGYSFNIAREKIPHKSRSVRFL